MELLFGNENGDMGWFYLNQKEYDYYKSQLVEVKLGENGFVL